MNNPLNARARRLSVTLRRGLLAAVGLSLVLGLVPCPALADQIPGHLDTGFDPGSGTSGTVHAVAIQSNGKVVAGGAFHQVDGTYYHYLARLNTDGSLDTSFVPGDGPSAQVRAIAVQPDDKIVIGGYFNLVNGTSRLRIARLNADGSLDTSFDPGAGANDVVHAIAVQDDGKVLIAGDFTEVDGVSCNHFARLNADGSLDTSFNLGSGADDSVRAVAVQPDGRILIAGSFTEVNGVAHEHIVRLNTDGSFDTTFTGSANGFVGGIALQSDGKIILVGGFSHVNGTLQRRIARIDANGTLDLTFTPSTVSFTSLKVVAVQSDDKFVVGGEFTSIADATRNNIARFNADGSLDTGFDTSVGTDGAVEAVAAHPVGKVVIGGEFTQVNGVSRVRIAQFNGDGTVDTGFHTGDGPNHYVEAVALHPEGKVLIGGRFTEVDGTPRHYVARLNADGSLDTTFEAVSGPDDYVEAIAVQPDGKVIIGGRFEWVSGLMRRRIARLNTDGSHDTSFFTQGANDRVSDVVIQPDGKVLVGGWFRRMGGVDRGYIARLNDDGSLDTGFDTSIGANSVVEAVALQPDGKVLIGGYFTSVNGTARNRIARLNADGSLDTTFDPGSGANDAVHAISIQDDGRIFIGGDFTSVNDTARNRIAQLNADGSLDTSFDPGTGADNIVYTAQTQPGGKVLIGGFFGQVNGVLCMRIAQVNVDGSLDADFDASLGAAGDVLDIAIQPDGKLVIGGQFMSYSGEPYERVARINGVPVPTITSAPPPSASFQEAYSHAFTAAGFPTRFFHITSGNLPAGLTLDRRSGLLSGIPTRPGVYTFTVTACNYIARSQSQTVTLVVEGYTIHLPLVLR